MLESKVLANKRWNEKNKEKMRYYNAKSAAKSFIKKHAIFEDLEELEKIIADKKKELLNNKQNDDSNIN